MNSFTVSFLVLSVLTFSAQTGDRVPRRYAIDAGLLAQSATSASRRKPVRRGSVPAAANAALLPVPRILFTDVETGPVSGGPNNLGVPISIFGKGFGAVRGTGHVTIGGIEVSSYQVWGANNAHNHSLDMIVIQAGRNVTGGAIVVSVNGQSSNSDFHFTANSGKVLYVSPAGADGNPCSVTSPCGTILHAAQVMKPGDTVLVRGGQSTEGEVWIRAPQGGIAGQAKVIKNYPGEEAVFGNAARDMLLDADYITVSGLNFRNGKALFATGWASRDQRGARFINNTFTGKIGYAAIEITGHDHVVAGNVCDITGSSVGTMGHCYYVTQGSNVKVLYNVAKGAPGYGLHVYDERRDTTDFQRVIKNLLIEGNTLAASTQRSGLILSISDAGRYGNAIDTVMVRNNVITGNNHNGIVVAGLTRNIKIYNNTFYQNGRQGIYVENDGNVNSVDIRNNLIYESDNGNCKADCGFFGMAHVQVGAAARNVTLNNNSYQPGSPIVIGNKDANALTGAVQFTAAGNGDFHTLSGSVVIDHGVALPDVPTDYDGNRRPQGTAYDIGAFEYRSRVPVLTSLANSASFIPAVVSPGSIVTGFGWNLGPSEPVPMRVVGAAVERQLADTRVLFDGIAAPLLLVCENQVSAVVPYEIAERTETQVEIEVGGELSEALAMRVAPTTPGIFTAGFSGSGPSAALNEDGQINLAGHPARKGSTIILYATGLGQTQPPGVTGRISTEVLPVPMAAIAVEIGGLPAVLTSASAAPGSLSGMFQIGVRVPDDAPSGSAVPLVVRAGTAQSQDGVTLAVM